MAAEIRTISEKRTTKGMAYDPANVFARILRGEIPCKKVYEDAHTLAFHDVAPQAPVHVLVIPKSAYTDFDDFTARASEREIAALHRAVTKVAEITGISGSGYRVLCNVGANGGQEVPHVHLHVFGGRRLGRMLHPA